MNKLSLVIKREFMQRVKRKSFIITTLLMPILMIGLMCVPAVIAVVSEPEAKIIAVVDNSNIIGESLQDNEYVNFIAADKTSNIDSLKNDKEYYGVLVIGENVVDDPSNVTLFMHEASSLGLDATISNQLKDRIENVRLQKYNIDNLKEILNDIEADVTIQNIRLDQDESESSSELAYILGMAMVYILYMFVLLYGQMVMNSIIEEKNNRVLEVMVSSVSPTILMLGKILGIGLVAVTQILIWAALIIGSSAWILPGIISDIATGDSSVLSIVNILGDAGYITSLFAYLILFLIGGFLLYASIFAAIGSSVDNVQDAGQLASIPTFCTIIGLVVGVSVIMDPTSTLATITSIIPITSPLVMIARIPFGIPTWEIITSLIVLYISFMVFVWLAAKIYRVGIFMYGKKPTFAELIRWAKYK
jgi:ABC-2 type transport system permease protein